MKQRYLFICNPNAGGRHAKAMAALDKALQSYEIDYQQVLTERQGHATEIANQHAADYDIIVVVGGDGTLNEVINAKSVHNKVIGIIPAGSGNDFARSCNIPVHDVAQAMKIVMNNQIKAIDLGIINDRYFINGVGLGLPSTANEIANKLRFIPGGIKYYFAILAALFMHQQLEITIDAAGVVCKNPTLLLNIANGRYQGSGLQVAPDAKLDSGTLKVMHCEHVPLHQRLLGMYHFLCGAFEKMPHTTLITSPKVHITFDGNLVLQSDGEILSYDKEVTMELLPQSLKVIGAWNTH